jgi:hypothetical protein
MGYELLKDNYYVSGIAPLGVPLGFGLRYDPNTGDYELKQKGLGGSYDIGIGLAVFYKNGSWYGDALRDPKLFKDGKPTALANQLSEDIRRKVNAAYIKGGGSNSGLKINKTAIDPTGTAGINNFFPGNNAGLATAVPGGTILSSPPGSLPKFSEPLDFPSANEEPLFGTQSTKDSRSKLLVYPVDILENRQDTLRITMYNYSSPSGESLFGGQDPGKIVVDGLQRLSGAKFGKEEFKGTVILPIPNNASDANSVAWAEDSMNNITAALLAKASGNLALAAGGALAGALTKAVAGVNPSQAIYYLTLLQEINPDLKDPKVLKQVNSLVASLSLKQAGIDISPETILSRGFGVVPNSNMELLFNSPKLRSFEFSWRLSPRSANEAKTVKRIIRFFKQGMAARKLSASSGAGAASALLGTPNVFKLQYKTADDKAISGLNRFKLCALTGFSVNYTPDGQWSAYDEGQPVSVNLGMGFTELEPIFESDYQDKIFKDLKGAPDLDEIGPDDVGY